MKTKDPSRARDESRDTAPQAQNEAQPVQDSDSSSPLEQRLRAILEEEKGSFESQRAAAERRLQEAQNLIVEARTESQRERARADDLEKKLAKQADGAQRAIDELDKTQSELNVTLSQLEQARSGLETYEAAREKL